MPALRANTRLRFSDNPASIPAMTGALPPCRLIVVDDDEWMRVYLASVLRSASYEVDAVDSGEEALRLLRAGSYDILLTDCQMPGMDGLTLCERVRAEFCESSPYILMFTVKDTREDRYAGLKSGADEYIIKGAPKSEMLAKLNVGRRIRLSRHALARSDAANRSIGLVDPLTNAHSVNYFTRQMAKEIERARRGQRSLSVLSCRIERLEQIARMYGHAAADLVLRAFSDDTRQCLRTGQDWFARIGEDRFAVVLPRTRSNGAERMARSLRRRFGEVPVFTAAGSIRCTVNIDVTACEPWLDWTPLHDLSDDSCAPSAGRHRWLP
jgi:diguanylate cyclase (GGDEF)-like protein